MASPAKFVRTGLTPKQEHFARVYAISGNATSAALQAGYTARNPSQLAYQQLQKPTVLAAVQRHRQRIGAEYSDIERTVILGLFKEAYYAEKAQDRVEALIALAQITGLLPRRVRR